MQLEVLGTPCSPAPDVVQEGVLSLHSEGQQCHLWETWGSGEEVPTPPVFPPPAHPHPHCPRVQVLLLLHLLPGVHHLQGWEGREGGCFSQGQEASGSSLRDCYILGDKGAQNMLRSSSGSAVLRCRDLEEHMVGCDTQGCTCGCWGF